MITRIGTFSNANALLAASLRTQGQLADQQAQQASGHRSTSLGGLGGDAGKLLNLSGQSARLTADNAAATSAATTVQAAYSAVGNVLDLATTIRSQLAAATSGTGGASITADTASNWLSTLQSLLNTQVGGAYVFGGQATDREPADFASAAYAPTGATPPDTGYYAGSAAARTLSTSQGETLSISVTADGSGFAKLANALSMMAANPTDPATLQSAYSEVSSATTDLGASQATLSSQAAALDSLISANTDKITTLDNLSTQIDGADLATATVKVTQFQAQLEALYSAIAKLSANSLLKYLQ